ncbi:MAG: TatD family hydrolase [Fimbriimonadaceae bacterium]|nr:TatD family hydrolase [Fimbriimonadaceae bacterium]
MVLFDTHCHLNDPKAFPNPSQAIREAKEVGVEFMTVIGIDPDSSRLAMEIADAHDGVTFVAGRHPNYAADYDPAELKLVEEFLDHPKCVALGEIGLDYHWDFALPEQQLRCTLDQLALARDKKKPVVIHCREAYPDLLSILEREPAHSYLFHCFGGDADDAKRVMELDGYFGVDGPITYKNSQGLRELVKHIPLDRIVLETDSPYLTPEPYRGKPNSPKLLPIVNAKLAECLGLTADACAIATIATGRRFYGIS